MIKIEDILKEKFIQTIDKLKFIEGELPEIHITSSKGSEHGDLTTNVAMILASRLKKNPREIAQTIVGNFDREGARISKIEIAGPGFINITLDTQFYTQLLEDILTKGEAYGRSDWGKQKKTQVEFVSANPTGPLTIGHGRQAVLGDTIARLLEATGHQVQREYYFNDAGRQMRMLGDSVRLRYRELLGEKVEFPEDHYQGEYIRDIARKAIDEKGEILKDADEDTYFTDLAEGIIFEEIKTTLARLGIVFDEFYNEKSLYETGRIDNVLSQLKEKDLAYDAEGAVWFRTTRLGQDQDRVIVKSTGEPTYRLPDIAYHVHKMERGFDLVVDIFGADHVATYPDVLAGLEALGFDSSRVKVLIHQFVTLMEGAEKIKMSTRKANFVTLDELIDEAGEDVTRYFFIHRSMSSHLNFDLSLAKTQTDENPVYYVQYAHARICSILRHAVTEGVDPEADADLNLLETSEELDLIRILTAYPDVISDTARDFEPHRLPAYLEEVATQYHRFQHAGKQDARLRVVTSDIPVTLARLALCRAARVVLANGLTILGISKPEQM